MAFHSSHRNFGHALLIAAVFLCMQVAAVVHAASFGDGRHTHDGAPCSVQLLSDAPTTPAACSAAVPVRHPSAINSAEGFDRLTSVNLDHSRAIRGPPVLSD
jgi:hypothetical protein